MTAPKPVLMEGFVHDGVLEGLTPSLSLALRDYPNGPVELELRPQAQTRRARANNYYMAVVLPMIAKEMGEPIKMKTHDLMKWRHNYAYITDPATGEEIRVGQSTKDLTVDEFSAFLEAVMLDGMEQYGITFPPPRQREAWVDPLPTDTKVEL